MTEPRKTLLPNILLSTVGVGLLCYVLKNRFKLFQKLRYALNFRNPLRHMEIQVVETYDDCWKIVNRLKSDCKEYQVLGLDCEWVTVGGTRRPVALLQLASHQGLCALFRLCSMKSIPKDLRELLEDESILKVGVAVFDDVKMLARDYGVGVGSIMDLRFLALQSGQKPEGLAKLSQTVLNVTLDKHWRIRCSDWEAPALTEKQQDYAAKDALVAVELFKKLIAEINPRSFWQSSRLSTEDIMEICQPFIDRKFNQGSATSGKVTDTSGSNGYNKKFNRSFFTRSKRLYDNCFLEAPDGELLSTCDRKKLNWYVIQGLGELVSEEPFTVRLKFEPAGRAVGEVGKFYTLAKENQCVVCGRKDAYIRKNVVPREYRKHFPVVMKSHTSHDVLLMCPDCHQTSNIYDLGIRERLAAMCDAPITGDAGQKFIEIPKLKQVRSSARAMLNSKNRIPEERKEQLRAIVQEYYNVEVTDELLKEAANLDFTECVENYTSHGEKVVTEFKERLGGLVELEKMWREHFLKIMKPKYLPDLWSVTHNANRLEIRAIEGRVKKDDMEIAGLDPSTVAMQSNRVENR